MEGAGQVLCYSPVPILMTESRPSRFHQPVAFATFAGLLGAGILDALLVLVRGHHARLLETIALALGLYGVCGLLCALLFGWAAATVLGALPGGFRSLLDDEALDARASGLLLGGTLGALVLAAGAGFGHKAFVASMNSQTLATIASAGLALVFAVPGVLVLLATWRLCARLAQRFVPRRPRLPRAAVVLLLLGVLGVLALVAALSRADWRVLDLGPLWSAGLALLLGLAHGWFWYVSAPGKRLLPRLPTRILRPALAIAVVLLLILGSRIGETSPTYAAISEGGLGLKLGLKLARHATDRDGDGYSALFGGGDCDDRRPDVYPGGEDIPGDGIDQNCEGGDAPLPAPVAESPQQPATAAPRKPAAAGAFAGNILIIAVDATRADRLGVAGYGRPPGHSLTPNLDALARRGAYFRRVWAQAPNTPRSFPSFVTSRYPSEIAWQKKTLNYSPLLPSNHTFFEPMAAACLRPIGIFSHFYFTADRGISRGFAEWSDDGAKSIADSNKDIAAPRIVPRVIARLQKAAAQHERFVLWTHLFEPHSSYMSHPEFPTSLSGVQGLEEKYDYEIAYDDLWIGKILKTLDQTGLADSTAIVAFGDHGEAWGEHHRIYFHGQNLTEEQIRVPLIFVIPGRKPVTSDAEVGLIDVGPTLLDLLGIQPPAYLHGRSLLPAIDGGELPPRPIFSELLPSTSTPDHQVIMVDRGKKLVHKVSDRRFELFDLAQDPGEKKNLADDPAHKQLLDELKVRLLAHEEKRDR
jgi:arylsulfatase A-like enzyme